MDIWILESVVSIVKHIHIDKNCVLTPVLLGMRLFRRAILYLRILLGGLPRHTQAARYLAPRHALRVKELDILLY